MTAKPKLFISRAGADEAFSTEIARVLEADGYELVLQQRDFANKNFLNEMDEVLASGARVVGLLSAEYLTSKNCRAEWLNALAGDPLNENGRLILLRVAECEPAGLLSGIAYWDLLPIRDNRAVVAEVVRNAVKEGGRRELTPVAGAYWRAPRTILDPDAVRETASFTGREAELRAVDAALWNGRGVAAICGLGGVGKSVLAREYARRNAGRYAVVWRLQAQTENGVIDGLLRLGARFVPELEKEKDRRAAALEVTNAVLTRFENPLLLIFDNLEDDALLRTWRPRARTHLLATSRDTAWGGDVAGVRLGIWPVADAASYVRRESGRDDITEADAARIANALGSLPLALSHAAAYLKRTKTVTPAGYLARINHHLATAPKGAEYDRAVFATFRAAIAQAEAEAPGACALLCLCSFFAPDSIPEELCTQEIELPTVLSPALDSGDVVDLTTAMSDAAAVEEAIGALDRLSLVTFDPETRTFTIHRLVQAAARTLLPSEDAWASAAVAAVNSVFPLVEYATWSTCDRFLPHGLAAITAVDAGTATADAARLANQCALYLRERAEFPEAEALARRAVAMSEATHASDDPHIASCMVTLGDIVRIRNKPHEAGELYRRALEIDERYYGPNHPEVALDLGHLALFYVDTGRIADAEPLLQRVLKIDEAHYGPEHPAVARGMSNLAYVMAGTGRLAEAEQLCRRGLDIDEKAYGANHPDVAYRLIFLAQVLNLTDRSGEAETAIRRALVIVQRSFGPNHPDVAAALRVLATVLSDTGRRADAEANLRRALSIDEASYGPQHPTTITDLERLGALLSADGRGAEAASFYQRARALRESAGD